MNEQLLLRNSIPVKQGSLVVVWLFHIAAIIGISLGYFEWFISKTPLNLLVLASLLIFNFPIDSIKKWQYTFLFFAAGMLVEWVGVQYGFLFGEYYYGKNLGVKLDGVPLLIGVNWAVLVLITGAISNKIKGSKLVKIIVGAFLMVFLDYFMEVSAPPFDFWIWLEGAAPLRNYISWFLVAAILHFIYQKADITGDFTFSCHLYAAQLLFFCYFYGVYSL